MGLFLFPFVWFAIYLFMITPEQKIELYKYWKDPIYAMETLFHTPTPQGEVIPFRLTDNQKILLVGMEYHRFNVVKKSRQLGTDTVLAAWVAYKCVIDYEVSEPEGIIFNTHMIEVSYDFIRKVKIFADQIPNWVWNHSGDINKLYKTDSRKELVFFNNCRVKGIATSRDALRGWTMTQFIMDSASYYGPNGQDMLCAMLTCLGTGGKAIIISTPNGMDSFFEPLYTGALNMTNNFNSINLHWAHDYRFNKDMVWTKLDETVVETEYTRKSIGEKLVYGWRPVSTWSEDMRKKMLRDGYNEDYLNQELYGDIIEYYLQ